MQCKYSFQIVIFWTSGVSRLAYVGNSLLWATGATKMWLFGARRPKTKIIIQSVRTSYAAYTTTAIRLRFDCWSKVIKITVSRLRLSGRRLRWNAASETVAPTAATVLRSPADYPAFSEGPTNLFPGYLRIASGPEGYPPLLLSLTSFPSCLEEWAVAPCNNSDSVSDVM